MNEETRAKLRKSIGDILNQFVEPHKVTTASLPLIPVDKALDDIEEAFIQVCGNCESTCPNCNGPLEKRTFIDTPDDISENWWCPACRLRWLGWDFEPEARAKLEELG